MNVNVHPITIPKDGMRAVSAMDAAGINNEANAAARAGDHETAEKLHKEALRIKESALGPDSVGYALSANALGEAQIHLKKWDEAETNLKNAVRIREAKNQGFDGSVSRDNLAQVYEAQGNFEKARAIRTSKPQEMACTNYDCTFMGAHKIEDLKQCGQCKSTFYCRKQCQQADWNARHKHFCKPLAST